MVDILSQAQRSFCMSQIRGKDTQPEIVIRNYVHGMGYRFRLHDKSLPGRPDLIFKSRRKIIFVHGCFWHRHCCRAGKSFPKTNKAFWDEKFEKNRIHDRESLQKLKESGWNVLVVWECQIKKRKKWLFRRIKEFLVD